MPLQPVMPSDPSDIAHLLRRTGFAALPSEVTALSALDWADAVDHVLDTGAAPDPGIGVPDLSEHRGSWDRYVDMVHFWTDRAAFSPAPIVEKMTLFWHGHFCTSLDKVFDHAALFAQNQLFRSAGLGNLIDLTTQVSLQPAMLQYLDNDRNVLGSPNDNFARELMELFTLGVGQYTEDDVAASARAWTGHRVEDGRYVFDASRHDTGQKTFFGATGNFDGPDIIQRIFAVKGDRVAQFIATKLWSFLAHPDPDPAVVAAIAPSLSSRWVVADLVRAILVHPEFRSTRSRQGLVRSPVEYAVATMKHTGIPAGVAHPEWSLGDMGQALFRPPNVAGWKQNEYWISTSALWAKSGWASRLRWHRYQEGALEAELAAYDHRNPGAFDHRAVVRQVLAEIGVTSPADSTMAAFDLFFASAPARWEARAGLLMLPYLTPDVQMG